MSRRALLLRAVGLALVAPLLLAACGRGGGASPVARTLPDAWGEPVALPRTVARVVTTVPGLTDTVVALGARDLLVGVSDREGDGPGLAGLPTVPVYPQVPAEVVAALLPDVVLVDAVLSRGDLPVLRARFPTFAADSRSLDGLATTFARLGDVLGRPAEAARLVGDLERARAESRVPGAPRVLLLAQVDPPVVLGPGSLLDDVIRAIGAVNVASDLGRPSGVLSSEAIRARAPAWILHTSLEFPDALRARWADVPAVRDGRVLDVHADAYVRAGPATAGALRRLARALAPAREDGPR